MNNFLKKNQKLKIKYVGSNAMKNPEILKNPE
jgi:hypothetical protein